MPLEVRRTALGRTHFLRHSPCQPRRRPTAASVGGWAQCSRPELWPTGNRFARKSFGQDVVDLREQWFDIRVEHQQPPVGPVVDAEGIDAGHSPTSGGKRPGRPVQALIALCPLPWAISILRGLAFSSTGIVNRSTPSV